MRSISEAAKRVGAAAIDPLCKFIAAIGILAMVVQVAFTILAPLNCGVLAFIIPIAAYAFGFALTGVMFLLLRHRVKDDNSYEGVTEFVNRKLAAVPIAVMMVISLLLYDAFFEFFRQLMLAGILKSFDEYSIQPMLCIAMVFFCGGAGVIVQFYPYGRLMSERVMVVCLAISTLCTLMTSGSMFIGAMFAIYAACAVLMMNQAYIMHAYKALTVTKITPSARLYSLRMVLLCLVLTAIGGVIVFIAVNGLWRVLLFLFYLLVYTVIANATGGHSRHEEVISAEDYVFGSNPLADVTNKLSVVGFILLGIFAVVFIIFGRNADVRRIIDAIKQWFDEFIAAFMGSRELEREPEINYKDEVETLDKVKTTRTQQALSRIGKLTLRDFNSEMAGLKSDEEKLSYSYLVMISLLSELNTSLRAADTPRELAGKIAATMEFPQIGEITNLIEEIKYAESASDADTSARVLTSVRTMVERHLV